MFWMKICMQPSTSACRDNQTGINFVFLKQQTVDECGRLHYRNMIDWFGVLNTVSSNLIGREAASDAMQNWR